MQSESKSFVKKNVKATALTESERELEKNVNATAQSESEHCVV